ncbi:unnamed protein product [Acanthoscelides obtectus]|uniref:Laminin N-terminal domain-containing protein n=1 Tax=Acanthoscelides obtectus TaxID=200917 RepID=A0A9P0K046_ACAOB|nr:unnamed protein product [Acanthoscelides obtectus]CAK1654042.1 Laminin subunit alpha [Acanthoscelides obtectus]
MVRAAPALRAALGAALLALLIVPVKGESLTPPYFNLAEGKRITASATCGEGLQGPEMYCKLIGTNGDNDLTENVIQGQYCDHCDPDKPDKRHPPEYAVDGMETWWQSPPLSRGMKYNEVNLTIELGQDAKIYHLEGIEIGDDFFLTTARMTRMSLIMKRILDTVYV